MNGIVYLVQPETLIGTNRYKIGMSNKTTIERIKQYGKNAKCIAICAVANPSQVEIRLKIAFAGRFKLIAGKEYFEGNMKDMVRCFNRITCISNYGSKSNSQSDYYTKLLHIVSNFIIRIIFAIFCYVRSLPSGRKKYPKRRCLRITKKILEIS